MEKMNRNCYEKVVWEDVGWLRENAPDSLEREHIIAVLERSVELEYGPCGEGSGGPETVLAIWRDASEEPSLIGEPVVYCTANGRVGAFRNTLAVITGKSEPVSNWRFLSEKYDVRYWTYTNEIVPPNRSGGGRRNV